MHLLYFVFLVNAECALHKFDEQTFKAINFALAINGWKLTRSVFKKIHDVESERSCQKDCVSDSRCLSYNFLNLTTANRKMFRCELCDSDRFSGWKNFVKDDKALYRGIQSACERDSSLCGDNGVCIPDYEDGSTRCKCKEGYKPRSHMQAKNCAQLRQDGITSSGVCTINPDGNKALQVFCDMTTDGGGWTVFQRRLDGSVNFYRSWIIYKRGLGNLNGEFWIGNDNLHHLTTADNVTLRVDLEDFDGNITYAEYTTFKVANESDKYRLLIRGYSDTAGDSMKGDHSQTADYMQFSTRDQDNDKTSQKNCAVEFKGAWWYNKCHWANLNGQYLGGPHESFADGVNWRSFRGYHYSLKRVEMKIKPTRPCTVKADQLP